MTEYLTFALTKGQHTIVDKQDAHFFLDGKWLCLYRGRGKGHPCAARFISVGEKKQKLVYLHRSITRCPQGYVVDHINGNPLDNRRVNLRICTQKQNAANVHKPAKWKGVYLRKNGKGIYWQSQIKMNGKTHSLGCFKNPVEAAAAYNKSAEKYFGEFACLNDLSLPYPSSC